MLLALKYSEPITLCTDGFLGIQCLIFAILVIIKQTQVKTHSLSKIWTGFYLNLAVFAFAGAISHFTTNLDLYAITWPISVISGGIALFCFQIAFLWHNSNEILVSQMVKTPSFIIAIIGILIYLTIIPFTTWNFAVFSGYLVIIAIHFLLLSAKNADQQELMPFNHILKRFLLIILILGIIQVIGKIIQWNYYFGDKNQFLFQPANEIFHIVALYPNAVLFKAIRCNYLQE
jgi:hypothetical protein